MHIDSWCVLGKNKKGEKKGERRNTYQFYAVTELITIRLECCELCFCFSVQHVVRMRMTGRVHAHDYYVLIYLTRGRLTTLGETNEDDLPLRG